MKVFRIGYLNYPWLFTVDLPVFLFLGADWDERSLHLMPFLEEISQKYDQKLIVGYVEVEYACKIFTELGIAEIPSVIGIDSGKILKPVLGVRYKRDLENYVNYIFGVLPYSPIDQYKKERGTKHV